MSITIREVYYKEVWCNPSLFGLDLYDKFYHTKIHSANTLMRPWNGGIPNTGWGCHSATASSMPTNVLVSFLHIKAP